MGLLRCECLRLFESVNDRLDGRLCLFLPVRSLHFLLFLQYLALWQLLWASLGCDKRRIVLNLIFVLIVGLLGDALCPILEVNSDITAHHHNRLWLLLRGHFDPLILGELVAISLGAHRLKHGVRVSFPIFIFELLLLLQVMLLQDIKVVGRLVVADVFVDFRSILDWFQYFFIWHVFLLQDELGVTLLRVGRGLDPGGDGKWLQ